MNSIAQPGHLGEAFHLPDCPVLSAHPSSLLRIFSAHPTIMLSTMSVHPSHLPSSLGIEKGSKFLLGDFRNGLCHRFLETGLARDILAPELNHKMPGRKGLVKIHIRNKGGWIMICAGNKDGRRPAAPPMQQEATVEATGEVIDLAYKE